MTETRERRYLAHLTERATLGEGMGIFTTYGYLTPCGEWVEIETISLDKSRHLVSRHQADGFWCDTSAQAMAAKADKIRAIAQRMLEQADELEAAAKATEAVAS